MKCVFDKCYDAVKCATDSKSYGFYYSEKQNPDLSIHIHNCCEVLLCVSGGKNFLIDDKVYDVNDGDLFIINQFEAHKITFDEHRKFCRYVMQVHPEFLYAHSSPSTNLAHCFYTRERGILHKITLTEKEREAFIGFIHRLEKEESYGDDIIKDITATEILILINSAFISRTGMEKTVGSEAIRKAIGYINENFSRKLSLPEIAGNSYVSVNKLCRLFNKYCGTTVSKYIASRRITEAKKLLSSGKSVTDTAIMCGFEDYANFIRVFKKHVGITPGKYSGNL